MRKILFIDRDGTLIEEPADQQIDSFEKFRLLPNLIVPLKRLVDAGYELVMVSNQDGLGTESFPEDTFWPPQNLLLHLLSSQGINFSAIKIDRNFAHQASDTRKPKVGMMLDYLADPSWDRSRSAVIGDRETDMQFAQNLGVAGILCGPLGHSWPEITHQLLDAPRVARIERITKETHIEVIVDLDAETAPLISTGIGFFDHMLEQLGKHGGFGLTLICGGDLHIDEHHTVEDSALALGQALRQALGDKRGIARYGFTLPMDETLATAALDLSGRAWFQFEGQFPRERVGELPTELVSHFFRSLCDTLGANLHLTVHGDNAHHMVEACFKVVARTLRQALRREGNTLPSTKGVL